MIKILLIIFLLSGFILANGVAIIDAETGTYLNLVNSEVQVNVKSQVAVITSTQTFKNTSGSPKVIKYGFPLPGTANATALRWKINGSWYQASFRGATQYADDKRSQNEAWYQLQKLSEINPVNETEAQKSMAEIGDSPWTDTKPRPNWLGLIVTTTILMVGGLFIYSYLFTQLLAVLTV